MLIKLLRNLQRKPPLVRKSWSLFLASSFTGIITILWFVNIGSQDLFLKNTENNNTGSAPFSNLLEESKEQLASIKSAVDETEVDTEENDQNLSLDELDSYDMNSGTNKRQENSLFFELSTTTLPEMGGVSSTPTRREVLVATTSMSESISPQFQIISTSTQQ